DETGMARDVDDSYQPAAGQGQVCKAEVDGHPPPLLLGQPVGVDAGQRLDQRGLAVVDVASGADDETHLRNQRTACSTAPNSGSSSPIRTVRGSRQQRSA